MGITVSHSPAAAAVGQAAYLGGLGGYRRYLDDIGLKQKQLAQNERLSLLDLEQRQFSQYLGIAANERTLGAQLANSQWGTMAGIAASANQQQNAIAAGFAGQGYGAGINSALQQQAQQADLIRQAQQNQFAQQQQQYGAAVDAAMQGQRLGTSIAQQQYGVAADTASQLRSIFSTANLQREDVAARDRARAETIAADRQNLIDRLTQDQWSQQYGVSANERSLAANMEQARYSQAVDLETRRTMQEREIQENQRSQMADLEFRQNLERQRQDFEQQQQQTSIAASMQQMAAQMYDRQQSMVYDSYMNRLNAMSQMAHAEKMNLFNANVRMAEMDRQAYYGQAADVQDYYQQLGLQANASQYQAYRDNKLNEFETQQWERQLEAQNQNITQNSEMRRQQELSKALENRALATRLYASGDISEAEAQAYIMQAEREIFSINQSRPQLQQPTVQQMVDKYKYQLPNGDFLYVPPDGNPMHLKVGQEQDQIGMYEQSKMNFERQKWEAERAFQEKRAIIERTDALMEKFDQKTGKPLYNSRDAAAAEAMNQLGIKPQQVNPDVSAVFNQWDTLARTVPQMAGAVQEMKGYMQKPLTSLTKEESLRYLELKPVFDRFK